MKPLTVFSLILALAWPPGWLLVAGCLIAMLLMSGRRA